MAALQAAGEKAPDGVSLEIAGLSGIPTYNDEVYQEGFPTAVETPRGQTREADALLFTTPE